MAQPQWGDQEYDLLFKAVENTQAFVPTNLYMRAQWGDLRYDLLFKLASNVANIDGGSSSSGVQVLPSPSSDTDFSGLPNGVAPTSGIYMAPRNENSIWEISAGQTQWKIVSTDNP